MKKSKMPKFAIRKQRLCCLLDPTYECELCHAKICDPCNEIDLKVDPEDDGHGVERVGHTKKKCSKLSLNNGRSVWMVIRNYGD